MTRISPLVARCVALALTFALAAPAAAGAADRRSHSSAASYFLQAEILPAADTAVGSTALSGGTSGVKFGESVWANGVADVWTTGSYTINFLVFVFSSRAEKGKAEFKVVSPTKATVYNYSFTSTSLPQGEDWFTFAAKADYAATGTYFAEFYFDGHLDGWIPLSFSA